MPTKRAVDGWESARFTSIFLCPSRILLPSRAHARSALTDEDIVPEYRTVAGQYHDIYGRPFLVRDPKFIGIIQEKFQVAVHVFTFSPIAVSGILASIRSRLSEKLFEMRLAHADTIIPSETERENMGARNGQPQQVNIYIGDGTTISGDVIVATSIANSFSQANSAEIPNDFSW